MSGIGELYSRINSLEYEIDVLNREKAEGISFYDNILVNKRCVLEELERRNDVSRKASDKRIGATYADGLSDAICVNYGGNRQLNMHDGYDYILRKASSRIHYIEEEIDSKRNQINYLYL